MKQKDHYIMNRTSWILHSFRVMLALFTRRFKETFVIQGVWRCNSEVPVAVICDGFNSTKDCWVEAHPNYAASHIYSLITTQTLKAPISLPQHNIQEFLSYLPMIPAWPLALLSPNPQSLHSKVFPNTLAGFPSCQYKPKLSYFYKSSYQNRPIIT
jgi:hypothetical protein